MLFFDVKYIIVIVISNHCSVKMCNVSFTKNVARCDVLEVLVSLSLTGAALRADNRLLRVGGLREQRLELLVRDLGKRRKTRSRLRTIQIWERFTFVWRNLVHAL